jgi:hypothetical protein
MKNIILLGNGFDLAHNLNTSYNHFISYLGRKKLAKPNSTSLIEIRDKRYIDPNKPFSSRESFIQISENEIITISSQNSFLLQICQEIGEKNWCDIESLYYKNLKERVNSNINTLNTEFNDIKNELENYISTLDNVKPIESFTAFFNEISKTGDSLCLNFNYTDTFQSLYNNTNQIKSLSIHGELNNNNNPIIFGYSATESENEDLLKKGNNEFLKNIKRYHYNRLPIDRTLNKYLDSNDKINIYIIGHSCGTPDTNILDRIFSDKNVRSIEIFYYKNYENYFDSLINIRRIQSFTENFDRITIYQDSFKCPQFDDVKTDVDSFKNNLNNEILTLRMDSRPKINIR